LTVRYESSAPADYPQPAEADLAPRRTDQYASDPLVQKVVELFEARVSHVEAEARDDA
jgi:DNA polymerase-3 subunit gamma/tau